MHCILNYPTNNEDANLLMIKSLSKVFPDSVIGYSDHTLPDENLAVPVVGRTWLGPAR